MPTITIKNLNNKSVTYSNTSLSVLNVLHENKIDWMHACGGKGKCTTCKMIVHQGNAALSEYSAFEQKCLSLGTLQANERLACQCQISEDIEVSVPETSKMPHVNYTH